MPPTAAKPDDYLLPDGFYPIKSFMRIAKMSQTTLWRIEHIEGIKLERVKSGGKVYVEGAAGIEFIKERARRQAERMPD